MGLERLGMQIWWQGYSGLKFENLKNKLFHLHGFEPAPTILVIHIGGNDIGVNPLHKLISLVRKHLVLINRHFPKTRLVWSQILPRTRWRYSSNNDAMERCRLKVNRVAAKSVLKLGGCYIKYPDLIKNIDQFLMPDGVHLNELGNDVFLNNLQGGLEYFELKHGSVYPDNSG